MRRAQAAVERLRLVQQQLTAERELRQQAEERARRLAAQVERLRTAEPARPARRAPPEPPPRPQVDGRAGGDRRPGPRASRRGRPESVGARQPWWRHPFVLTATTGSVGLLVGGLVTGVLSPAAIVSPVTVEARGATPPTATIAAGADGVTRAAEADRRATGTLDRESAVGTATPVPVATRTAAEAPASAAGPAATIAALAATVTAQAKLAVVPVATATPVAPSATGAATGTPTAPRPTATAVPPSPTSASVGATTTALSTGATRIAATGTAVAGSGVRVEATQTALVGSATALAGWEASLAATQTALATATPTEAAPTVAPPLTSTPTPAGTPSPTPTPTPTPQSCSFWEIPTIPVGSSYVLRFDQQETADVVVLWSYPAGAVSLHHEVDGRRVPVVTPRVGDDGSVEPSLVAVAEEQPLGKYVASLRNLAAEPSPPTYLALSFDVDPDCAGVRKGIEQG